MPRECIGDNAAHNRPAHNGNGIDHADIALIAATLARWHKITNDDLRQRHQPPCPQALNHAEDQQLQHGSRKGAHHRADEKNHHGRIDQRLAAILIAEFAIKGNDGG